MDFFNKLPKQGKIVVIFVVSVIVLSVLSSLI